MPIEVGTKVVCLPTDAAPFIAFVADVGHDKGVCVAIVQDIDGEVFCFTADRLVGVRG